MAKYKVILEYDPLTGYVHAPDGCMYMTISNADFEEYHEIVTNQVVLEKAIDKYTASELIMLKQEGVLS